MSNNTEITAVVSKGINNLIGLTSKVVPIDKIPSVYCFTQWLDSKYNNDNRVNNDYYNGSENDLVNIFIELLNLSHGDYCNNKDYILKRVEFLANEGLHMIEIQNPKTRSFKITPEQANAVIADLAKKTKKVSKSQVKKNIKAAYKDYKKKVKSSESLKPLKKKSAKRMKRDNMGRFTKTK